MSVNFPPMGIIQAVHTAAPGTWHWFLGGVINSAQAVPGSLWINSWWRSTDHNRRVGGHPDSQHLLGLALDVGGDPSDRELFQRYLQQHGLIALNYEAHLHVQAWPAGKARELGLLDLL